MFASFSVMFIAEANSPKLVNIIAKLPNVSYCEYIYCCEEI